MRISILTISDSVAGGKANDRSGPALAARCKHLGWEVVANTLLPDDRTAIESFLKKTSDSNGADVILTTGGTGLGPRDVTPEATTTIAERLIPGLSERMRAEGSKKTPRAILSRAVVAMRGRTIIVNLPGSPSGAIESFDTIVELLPHAIDVMHGARHGPSEPPAES